ncbi:MAG: multi-sensor signal transduction histidine kinase, partial [Armatimonadetes bacterium]|nr:multi-sensor signal transduction histidine kinase [Armatimonadota bacterium]
KQALGSILASLPVPVLVVSPDARLLGANEAASRLLSGVAEDGSAAAAITRLTWLRGDLDTLAGGSSPAGVRWLEIAGARRAFKAQYAMLDPDGTEPGTVAVTLTEVTELQGAGPDPVARRLLDHMPAVVWTVDRDLCFTACEGKVVSDTGDPHQPVVGRTLDHIFGPEGAGPVVHAAHQRAFAGEPATYDCRWQDRRFQASLAPLDTAGTEVIGVALDVTDRAKNEDLLRKAREDAERLIHTANVLIVGLDDQGAVTLFNEAAERATGYPASELLGRAWYGSGVPCAEFPEITTEPDVPGEYTGPIRTRTGTRRTIAWRDSVIRSGDARLGTLLVGVDVTDLNAAQSRLRDSEERHRTLLASLPQRIFVKDHDGVFVSVNERFAADFGLRPADLIGKSDSDFFEQELAEKYRADDRRVMETRATETIVEANVVQDRLRVVEVMKAPVIAESGELLGIVGVFTDVTDRKRIEDDLAHERDLLHTLMNNIPDQIYFKDRQSRFTRVNPAGARALGESSPDQVVGRSDFELHPEDLARGYYADEQHLMTTGEPVIGKLEMQRTPEGEERWLSSTKVPIRDRDGQVVGMAGISRDVTDRIEVEERLRKTAAELARSNEELQQFAYVASHDLQEPLRMVASYTQLLARRYRDRLDDDGMEFIDFAVDGATRMQNLIQDLLAYSRVGTRTHAFTPIPLDEVVTRALSNLRMALSESGAEVTHDPLPTIIGDSSQLVQLFQNLLGNALKFRGAEPPRVHVSAELRGAEWLIGVHDNGIGIEPEYAERIFVIFQRLHAKSDYPGSGIGLAICKKIVSRHGGTIWVEPAPEGGAVFRFTIPVDKRLVSGAK